ncbi:SPOR domain-containing protein [Treponema sp. TIM-1]|uniref:SPOR domain-containing protein n=1 Tax=Treponema sp. TIM-1 TaxID=2898417 RepID=UPI00397F3D1D
MKKILISFVLLVIADFCFPQQNLKIIGRIPRPDSEKIYRIQLGSFKMPQNAETVSARLRHAGFNPVYENYRDFTRVLLTGIRAWNMLLVLKNIELLGFREAWITEDRSAVPSEGFLVNPDEYAHGKNTRPPRRRRETPDRSAAPPDRISAEPEYTPDRSVTPPNRISAEPEYTPDRSIVPPDEVRVEPYPEEAAELPAKNVIIDPTYYTVMIGESKTIRLDTLPDWGVVWSSQDPGIATVDDTGKITGIDTGSTVVEADDGETVMGISVTVVPASNIHYVPKEQETFVKTDENTLMTPGTTGLAEYRTEPTARLAYRFVNPGDSRGASGINGGIDVLGKGKDDRWMWTTYYQGGFFYDLNGVQHVMTNGVQQSRSGIELRVEPSFVYIDGVSYLQLKHTLKNITQTVISGQRFGAGADIMIHNNDHASVTGDEYGLVMSDASDEEISSLNLMFVGKTGEDTTPVSTLWIGRWDRGDYLKHIYDDGVDPQYYEGADSAMAFSFQNITLLPDESKEFIVRFTLARNSN